MTNILILILSITSFAFSDPPSWDQDGNGIFDDLNSYEIKL